RRALPAAGNPSLSRRSGCEHSPSRRSRPWRPPVTPAGPPPEAPARTPAARWLPRRLQRRLQERSVESNRSSATSLVAVATLACDRWRPPESRSRTRRREQQRAGAVARRSETAAVQEAIALHVAGEPGCVLAPRLVLWQLHLLHGVIIALAGIGDFLHLAGK